MVAEGPVDTNYEPSEIQAAFMSPDQQSELRSGVHQDMYAQAYQKDMNRSYHSLAPNSSMGFVGTTSLRQQTMRNDLSMRMDRTIKLK